MRRVWGILAGAATAAALANAYRLYDARARERIAGAEGLDSPEIAAAFGRIAALPQMWLLRRIAENHALALCASGKAADLGCGSGRLAIELAQRAAGLHVTGVDLSNALLNEARQNAAAAGLTSRTSFRTGDAASTPFADGSLDLVVSTLSLHHWSDPIAVLNEVARILKPGGAFMLFDLRRDMIAPFYLLILFATRCVVPRALRHIGEPLGSRNAAYTPNEAAALAQSSRLTGWRITSGPLWLTIEGRTTSAPAPHPGHDPSAAR